MCERMIERKQGRKTVMRSGKENYIFVLPTVLQNVCKIYILAKFDILAKLNRICLAHSG
jgi:hypothetical protein